MIVTGQLDDLARRAIEGDGPSLNALTRALESLPPEVVTQAVPDDEPELDFAPKPASDRP